jgi:ABC-type lipoprotein export system ATPase subunit
MVTHDENIARNARRIVRLLDGKIVSDDALGYEKVGDANLL